MPAISRKTRVLIALGIFLTTTSMAYGGEIIVEAISPEVGTQRLGFVVKDANNVTRAELERMEGLIVKRGFDIPWRFGELPESDTFSACPYYNWWHPCLPYDRARYLSCVSDKQTTSVSGSVTSETKELCYLEATQKSLLDRLFD